MLMNAIIVGLVVMLAKFFDWWGGTSFQRPIACVSLLGILLGHPVEGIIMAAQLELVFLGNVSLGGVMPSDFTLGSIFGAAFAMILGKDIAEAITLAVPISMLGTMLYSAMKIVVTSIVPKFESYIAHKNIRGFKRLWLIQITCFETAYFLLGFLATLAGTDAVKALLNAIPSWVQASMTVAAGMLPAVGLALLLKSLWENSVGAYYFAGFGLGAFFFYNNTTAAKIVDGAIQLTGAPVKILSLVQISFIGAIVAALVIYSELRKGNKETVAAVTNGDESEDFFNE
jgi:mannose/fructose/N-acetylgalactosamine-specific phosphotransferase system component IIC